jgi:pre-mRNA-splicing factor CDC5/CEF1
VRDKLSINAEDDYDDPEYAQYQQKEAQDQLKRGLGRLPAPKNDYEIVVPENEMDAEAVEMRAVEDQSDVDARLQAEVDAEREAEMKKRSQAVQRNLPRPCEMNATVLRPTGRDDPPLSELQKAEELIKREMLCMMHHDALHCPTPAQASLKEAAKTQHAAFLQTHPYVQYEQDELYEAQSLLEKEMAFVKAKMNHGEITDDSYRQVWEQCFSQVLFLPSQQRYTRANLATKKERIESLEQRLELNRGHMTKDAKKAGKLEKKLKVGD